jgi:prolipoprotein diacylglyceryl transferase
MMFLSILSWLYWDPRSDIFTIPLLERPIVWYGVLFVTGFVVGYFVVLRLLIEKLKISRELASFLTDRLCWFFVIGTLIGARLGHVFFYEWPYYQASPWKILKTWEGGLASHGAGIGIILSVILYQRYIRRYCPKLSFLMLADILSIPILIGGAFIRLGNFVNQEIVGTQTTVPWAVIFGHPFETKVIVPRHPVQLYEAVAYLLIAGFLYFLWKKKGESLNQGIITGLLFILTFTARIFFELYKEHQYSFIDINSSIQMGQLLSIPYILLGFGFVLWGLTHPEKNKVNSISSNGKTG